LDPKLASATGTEPQKGTEEDWVVVDSETPVDGMVLAAGSEDGSDDELPEPTEEDVAQAEEELPEPTADDVAQAGGDDEDDDELPEPTEDDIAMS
jgi:hypothetical protein